MKRRTGFESRTPDDGVDLMRPLLDSVTLAALGRLTDEELHAVSLAVEFGDDPRGVGGFDKVRALFTYVRGGGLHVRDERVPALRAAVRRRSSGASDA